MNKVPTQVEINSAKELKYWKKKLSNRLFTAIPRWHEVELTKQEKTKSLNIKISEELLIALTDLNKRTNTHLKTTLLAAHCKVMSVLSGNIDILTGYKVISGNDTQSQNIIPFRLKLESGNWKEFIQKIEREQKEISAFHDHPLLELEKEISPISKLFETTFYFDDASKVILKNFSASVEIGKERDFPFQTKFSYQSEDSVLNLNITYNLAEFSDKQIENISGYYISALTLMSEDEEVAHELQSILSNEEKFKLLEQFNSNKVDFPIEKTFVDLFEEQVQRYPNSVSVKFGNNEWTYSELNNQANKVADHLIKNNISIEDAVVVVMERDHLWMASVLGIMKAGGVYVPVRPDWPESRKETILQKTKAKFVITDDVNESNLFKIIKKEGNKSSLIKVNHLLENTTAGKKIISRAKPDNLAYIIFTSGSTGEPKGAMIEHKGMLNHLFSKVNDLSLSANDVIAQNSSQSFDISVWQLISGLLVGAKTVIYSDALILDMHQFLNQIKENKITILELVPSYMEIILKLSNSNSFDDLKYLLVTGEPLKIGLVTSWFNFFKKIPLVNAYGPTEASDDITHHFMYDTPKSSIVPVGKPIQNLNIYVVDSYDQLVPIGTKGNVYVSGVGVGRGYIGDQEKTNAVFTMDHLKLEENLKLYKTGDIGSWTPEGILLLFGREDSQIKLNGYRIDLGEIEQCLSKQNSVTDNAVLLKEKQLHAFLVFENNSKDEQDQINQCKSELQKDLPHYMVPRKFHVLKKLPLTPNGKIDRKALQKTVLSKNR
ncbi:amino acid adenylation domain-containing protein [uncultured Croceitalea sp.]|uniref:non-ribosomal peptide synthetase n=1 Tax=uncultured Croceitalea sp. TaxID=1798908 RepID=UPI0033064ABD